MIKLMNLTNKEGFEVKDIKRGETTFKALVGKIDDRELFVSFDKDLLESANNDTIEDLLLNCDLTFKKGTIVTKSSKNKNLLTNETRSTKLLFGADDALLLYIDLDDEIGKIEITNNLATPFIKFSKDGKSLMAIVVKVKETQENETITIHSKGTEGYSIEREPNAEWILNKIYFGKDKNDLHQSPIPKITFVNKPVFITKGKKFVKGFEGSVMDSYEFEKQNKRILTYRLVMFDKAFTSEEIDNLLKNSIYALQYKIMEDNIVLSELRKKRPFVNKDKKTNFVKKDNKQNNFKPRHNRNNVRK